MRQDVGETLEVSRLELLRHASMHGDLEAWVVFQQRLEETVLVWLHDHPLIWWKRRQELNNTCS